jgi:hypothetical protein
MWSLFVSALVSSAAPPVVCHSEPEGEYTLSSCPVKAAARKEHDKLQKALRECEDWEREVLLPLAQQRIDIDLDDGVKVNYLKFGPALAPIAGLAAAEED